jgi:putative tryptophan/tyrosine transport system substrate-binding protein
LAHRRGLAEGGYVEGKNLTIEYRFTNFRPELILAFASDLVRLNMNVIVAAAPEAVAAVGNATTSIPIVALDFESDPVAKGYVKSLARPTGNMTGTFLDIPELSGKQIGLLKENTSQFAATEMAARALALEAEVMEVRVADDFGRALEAARTKHVEGGVLLASPLVFSLPRGSGPREVQPRGLARAERS